MGTRRVEAVSQGCIFRGPFVAHELHKDSVVIHTVILTSTMVLDGKGRATNGVSADPAVSKEVVRLDIDPLQSQALLPTV